MDNQQRRTDSIVVSKINTQLQPSQNIPIESNFGEFVYRDAISRKQYQYKILQIKKKKLTVNQIKSHQSHQTKSVIKDVGGHLQILSNIKQFRFQELLSSSKQLKKIREQISNAELSKYNEYKESLLKIRSNMIQSISNYNMDYFRKYMSGDDSNFDTRLNIMKRIESNKITQQQLQRFLKESNEEFINKQSTDIEEQEKRKALSQIMGKQIDQQFEVKYRKPYDILEKDIKNKINGQVKYLVEPENINYKSVKPSIKPCKKPLMTRQDEFQKTVQEIQSKSLDLINKFVSLQQSKENLNKQDIMNFEFLKSLIIDDNAFDLKCELNDKPEFIGLTDTKGNSLLHVAVKQSRVDAAKILLLCNINTSMKNKVKLRIFSQVTQLYKLQIILTSQKSENLSKSITSDTTLLIDILQLQLQNFQFLIYQQFSQLKNFQI